MSLRQALALVYHLHPDATVSHDGYSVPILDWLIDPDTTHDQYYCELQLRGESATIIVPEYDQEDMVDDSVIEIAWGV